MNILLIITIPGFFYEYIRTEHKTIYRRMKVKLC